MMRLTELKQALAQFGASKNVTITHDFSHKENGNIRTVSNAQKAYVLHHGKKGLKASYFVDDILAHSGGKAGDAMRQILDRHIQKKGL